MLVARPVDELDSDAYAVILAHDASLDYSIHVQFTCNLRQGLAGAGVLHDRGPRDHTYLGQHSEVCNQFVSHSLGEIVLRWIPRKIFQRQHRQEANGRWCRGFRRRILVMEGPPSEY